MINESVLFVGDDSRWSELASDHLRNTYDEVAVILWDHGDPKPDLIRTWSGDRIFCFKADLVVPPSTLERTTRSAINFHPCPPQYPGIGGYDYAVADQDSEFGVTSHHMITEIDAGDIIEVDRFPLHRSETAAVLRDRAAAHCLLMFYNIVYASVLNFPSPTRSGGRPCTPGPCSRNFTGSSLWKLRRSATEVQFAIDQASRPTPPR